MTKNTELKGHTHCRRHLPEERLWTVSVKGSEWTTPARCQVEAWDKLLADKPPEWWIENVGLLVTARETEAGDDETYAIHTCGLLWRYQHFELAVIADDRGSQEMQMHVLGKYVDRGIGWLYPRDDNALTDRQTLP